MDLSVRPASLGDWAKGNVPDLHNGILVALVRFIRFV